MLALLLALGGSATLLFCFLWLAMRAFQAHLAWGFLVLFVPGAPLFFTIAHWQRAKKPVLGALGGFGAILLAQALLPATVASEEVSAPVSVEVSLPRARWTESQLDEVWEDCLASYAEDDGEDEEYCQCRVDGYEEWGHPRDFFEEHPPDNTPLRHRLARCELDLPK